MRVEVLDALLEARAAKVPVVLATPIEGDGVARLVRPGHDDPLAAAAATALRLDRAASEEHAGVTWFLRPYNPPLRLVVVGAVHIAQPLVRMATEAGYAVTVVDPRSAFAAAARFPDVPILDAWPDDALEAMALDARTAVVTLTHDPKLDDPALRVALASAAFYVGALGSSRTHRSRVGRLERAGLAAADVARVRGPVGLDIGARTPAEIAIAILAQITETLRKPPVGDGESGPRGVPRPRRVAAVVLAAGSSRRMGGQNKLLVDLDGEPLIARTVDVLLASAASPVVVVTGHDRAEVAASLAGRDVVVVHNDAYAAGMSTSIRAGLAALPADVDGAMLALGDMPFVRPQDVAALLEAFDPEGGAPICVPVHERKRGHPVLWARAYFPELLGLSGDVGARSVLDAHAGEVHLVEVADAGVHVDVDTPEALEQVRRGTTP